MRWTTYAYLICGMAAFGSATPMAKLVTEDLHPLVASALRVVLAAAVLAPLAWRRGLRPGHLDGGDWWRAAVLAVVGMFGFTVMLTYGMQRASGVTGSIVMGMAPAVTATGAVLFMGESASWRRWSAVAIAVAGVVVLRLGGSADFHLLGAALVFGAVLGEATYTLVGKRLMQTTDAIGTAALATVLSLPLFLAAAAWPARDTDWEALGWADAAALAWWGLGTLALGSILWYRGVRAAPGHVAAAFMGIMPLSALLLSYLVLGEAFHWWHVPGFLLVAGAIGLIAWDQR